MANQDAPSSYLDRKVAGMCTRPGCPLDAEDDCNLCSGHRADNAKYARRRRAKNRKLWTASKLCLRCGDRRRKGSKWCALCLLKAGKLKTEERQSQRQIADKRVTRDSEGDGYARTRYHGQSRRGQQKRWQLDVQSIDFAIAALSEARARITESHEAEQAKMPRVQRDEIRNQGVDLVLYASRHCVEVAERNGRKRGEIEDIDEAAG